MRLWPATIYGTYTPVISLLPKESSLLSEEDNKQKDDKDDNSLVEEYDISLSLLISVWQHKVSVSCFVHPRHQEKVLGHSPGNQHDTSYSIV